MLEMNIVDQRVNVFTIDRKRSKVSKEHHNHNATSVQFKPHSSHKDSSSFKASNVSLVLKTSEAYDQKHTMTMP